jgi:multisubunit Na+/H+ antiporter MnhB subunit
VFLIGWPGGDLQSTFTIAAAIVLSYLALIWVTTILWAYRDIRGRDRKSVV